MAKIGEVLVLRSFGNMKCFKNQNIEAKKMQSKRIELQLFKLIRALFV